MGKNRRQAEAPVVKTSQPLDLEPIAASPPELYLAREVSLPVNAAESTLPVALARLLRVSEKSLSRLRVIRKSLDARKRNRPVWKYAVEFSCGTPIRHPRVTLLSAGNASGATPSDQLSTLPWPGKKVAVVGCGPAGLAAALALARKGYAVTVFEQGKSVSPRFRDIRLFIKQNLFDPHSNILFGEGGAGTFSDGKLTARTRNAFTDAFLRELVASGARESILTDHHPHLGTDQLQFIIAAFRERCEAAGAVFRFDSEVTDLSLDSNGCHGIVVQGERLPFNAVVLAPGLSAQRMYQVLADRGVALERKDFSVGARIEHPQDFINRCQLGDKIDPRTVGAAEYFLTWKGAASAAYSFCMCPGGVVIPCADAADGLSTNGMSYSNRASPFANAAIVVPVQAAKLPGGILAGLEYQQRLERAGFLLGGGDFTFPAQSAAAFVAQRLDTTALPASSFQKPLRACNLWDLFEPDVARALAEALRSFDRRLPGFIQHGLLIAPESRTSSPVRIVRNPDTLQSINTPRLYLIGEGAGYAGGIVSSGADGFRLAASVAAWSAA